MDKKDAIQGAIEALSGIDKLKEEGDKAVLRAAQEALSGIDADKLGRDAMRTAAETLSKKAEDERKKDKKAPARDTDEFIEKYYRKRFTPANSGKAYLLSFIFDVYKGNSRQVSTTLWNLEALKEKIKTEEDMRSFDAYYHLTEWLRNLYENSRTMRNALRSVISDYTHIATSILAAENIRRRIIATPITDKLQALPAEEFREEINRNPDTLLTLWLNTITIEAYTPQTDGGNLIQTLRDNIGEGLRYMVAYHTFLDVIADFTGIPECTFLKVKDAPIRRALNTLNEALQVLREDIAAHREQEIIASAASRPEDFGGITEVKLSPNLENLLPASLTFWTPEYLRATMEYFRPVEDEPPIPEKNVQYLRDYIRREFKTGIINWYVLYTWYSISYRIPPKPAEDSPKGRKGSRIRTGEGE